jgi:hypothetical protein
VNNGVNDIFIPCNNGLPGPARTCAINEDCNDVNGCFLFVIP